MENDRVFELIESENLSELKSFIRNLPNINCYVFDDPVSKTKLCLLHVLAGLIQLKSFDFIEGIFNFLKEHKNFNVNCLGVLEGNWDVTAAHIAVSWKNSGFLKLLINANCDLLICDSFGQNVEDYAIQKQNKKILSLVKNGIFNNFQKEKDFHQITLIKPIEMNNFQNDFREENCQEFSKIEHDEAVSCFNESFDSQSTELVYHNDDIDLIEERFESLNFSYFNDKNSDDHSPMNTSEESINDLILKMSDSELFKCLSKKLGQNPGPVTQKTRKLYQRKLHCLEKNTPEAEDFFKRHIINKNEMKNDDVFVKIQNYSIELNIIDANNFLFKKAVEYENELMENFRKYSKAKHKYFVYLLLDPSLTNNLPAHINMQINSLFIPNSNVFLQRAFCQFIISIFYVGKGQSGRPYQHFVEAYKKKQNTLKNSNEKLSPKTKRIWSIWDQEKGPISLHFFNGLSSDEALTFEALIIDALSLSNLTNKIKGQYRCSLNFDDRQRKILGTYLLFKFFFIYLFNGERQVRKKEFIAG